MRLTYILTTSRLLCPSIFCEVNRVYKAYQEEDLKELETIEDSVGGVRLKVERDDSGIVGVTNLETGEEIVKERDFWFAWYAFHIDTELYIK